jgi:hypothetical protein
LLISNKKNKKKTVGHILNGRHLKVHRQGNLLYQIKILIAKYGDRLKVILSGQEI